jgi:hypothetical protein
MECEAGGTVDGVACDLAHTGDGDGHAEALGVAGGQALGDELTLAVAHGAGAVLVVDHLLRHRALGACNVADRGRDAGDEHVLLQRIGAAQAHELVAGLDAALLELDRRRLEIQQPGLRTPTV